MLLYSQMKDILFSYNTDINFSNGDLQNTDGGLDFIYREIYKIIKTNKNSWKISPKLGCDISNYMGYPNNRDTATKIKNYLLEGLSFCVFPAKLDVRVVPTGYDKLLIFLDITHIEGTNSIPLEFSYSNGLTFIPFDPSVDNSPLDPVHKSNNIADIKKPNKYWQALRNS